MARTKYPAIGTRFGRWEVTGETISVRSVSYTPCQCDCGTVRNVGLNHLRRGTSKSCSCSTGRPRALRTIGAEKHGASNTKLYAVRVSMIQRCTNPADKAYHHYGGRGISVCEDWIRSFKAFQDWALSNGYQDDLEIDRVDVNGNYSPDNCRFVTCKENQRNRRNNHSLTAFGETKCLQSWAEDSRCMVSYLTLHARINRSGWHPEVAITTPLTRGSRPSAMT